MLISDKIKHIARIKQVSLRDISSRIGMSESGFHTALQKNRFKTSTLEKIAEVFEMSVDKLHSYSIEVEHPTDKNELEIFKKKMDRFKELTIQIEKMEAELFKLRLERDLIF